MTAQMDSQLPVDPVLHQLLSPTEQELLEEYKSLSANLSNLSNEIARLASVPTPEILDHLRVLERKTAVVFTLLKASVYSIFLQQQLHEEEAAAAATSGISASDMGASA